MRFQLLEGDCLELLSGVPPLSIDVAIADPPYIIGGTSMGNVRSKSGTWADMMNAASWYRDWFDAVAAKLKPCAFLLVFGNWRSLPTYLRAVSMTASLFPASCMVWDKLWIGPAHKRALRPRWELILWLAMPEAEVEDRNAADVVSEKWMACHSAVSDHPAEKPRGLLRYLLRTAAPKGGMVLDPFAGSGAAGLAALDLGMGYVGFEADPAEAAKARRALLEHVPAGGTLFQEQP